MMVDPHLIGVGPKRLSPGPRSSPAKPLQGRTRNSRIKGSPWVVPFFMWSAGWS